MNNNNNNNNNNNQFTKVNEFYQNLYTYISTSNLNIATLYFILKNLTSEIGSLYQTEVSKEYYNSEIETYKQEIEKLKKSQSQQNKETSEEKEIEEINE